MISIGQVTRNINQTIGGFQGVMGLGRSGPYTEIEGITSKILPNNWTMNLPYSFKVISSGSPIPGGNQPLSGVLKSVMNGLMDELILPINPKDINQTEQFSIAITPTQRGIISEHNGVIFKELVISGTTGQRPNNFTTGYVSFHQLKNFFRSYAQQKKDPANKHSQLIFINRKDAEQLIVEPVTFSMTRNSDTPFLYNYSMVFKVLGLRQPQPSFGLLDKFFGKAGPVLNKINNYFNRGWIVLQNSTILLKATSEKFKEDVLVPLGLSKLAMKTKQTKNNYVVDDLLVTDASSLSKKTCESLLETAKNKKIDGDINFVKINFPANVKQFVEDNGSNSLNILTVEAKQNLPITALTTDERDRFNESIETSLEKSREYYLDFYNKIIGLRNDALERFNVLGTEFNSIFGRNNKFTVSSSKKIVTNEADFLEAVTDIQKGLETILANNFLFEESLATIYENVRSNYDSSLILTDPSSVDEIVMPDNKTLEDLAAEYLGDGSRWIELALINNLVPPYVDENSTRPNVKKSGDKIFIPRFGAVVLGDLPKSKALPINNDFNEVEKNLGTDIKVNQYFDFSLDNNNDFKLISGSENMGQAIVIKLSLEKGSLKNHPEIGVGLGIGEKIRNGLDIRDDIILAMLNDRRTESINNLSFFTEGSTVRINLNLLLKYISTPIPVEFSI